MPDSRPRRPDREPDIATLIAMIAAASLATMAELALVLTAPLLVIWIAALLPVAFWAILLREVHRFLRDGQPTPPRPQRIRGRVRRRP